MARLRTDSLIAAFFLVALGGSAGCGSEASSDPDSASSSDASVDSSPPWGVVGPLYVQELFQDFNQASEVTIAAAGNDVVVAAIHQRFDTSDTFEYPQGGLPRQVAVATSHDRGATFAPPNAHGLPDSSDPVVIADGSGRFWLSVLHVEMGIGYGIVARSDDAGNTFTTVVSDLEVGDKEWLAVDASRQVVFVGGAAGYFTIDPDGARLGDFLVDGMTTPNWNAAGAYVNADGVSRFLTLIPGIVQWDGVSAALDGPAFDAGDQASVFTLSAGAIGVAENGDEWVVRSVRDTLGARIVLTLESVSGERTDVPLTDPDQTAFLPAAMMDAAGRLHVLWYDSAGTTGVLRYARSPGPDLTQPFLPPLVIDPNACPGANWYPYNSNELPFGGRRLREYIGIAVAGDRAHLAWTHAPEPPSLVYTTTVDNL